MLQLVTYIIALLITFPLLMTISLYLLSKRWARSKKQAVHVSMQYSAPFYLLSFLVILNEVFASSYLGLVAIFLLILLLLFIIIQWKVTGDIFFRRVWQLFLRTLFLIFFLANGTVILIALILKFYQL